MSKIDLTTVESGFLSQAALNSNFTKLKTELQDKVLYRDNPTGEPNSMQQDLDMNGHRILNVLAQGGEGFIWKGNWTTSTLYSQNNLVYIPSGTYTGSTAIVKENYTSSGSADTDFLSGKLEVVAARGASGAGTGDMLNSENLSGLTNTATARSNLGVPGLTTTNTFSQHQTVPDEAYNATTWDNNLTVPNKKAVRDVIEAIRTETSLLTTLTGNVTMNATHWGGTFANTSTSNYTVTLLSPTGNANKTVSFSCQDTGTLTISGTSMTINGVSGLSSYVLSQGQSLTLVCNNTGFVQSSFSPTSLGVGQTWQDVLSNRVNGTTYTNSTGRPIQVLISNATNNNVSGLTIVVNGVTIFQGGSFTWYNDPQASFVVPAGGTYSATTNVGFLSWAELR